ncbi:MAG: DNA repair protein RecO [Patescibacteria group bacterium]|nr:DNA repair protein RecO [Patescibacteria group bacterium]
MHEKYTTRGLIISASAYREADKIISIYTEDFGLVSAVAAGIRRSHSKLHFHVQEYSFRSFTLVRGRELWRLVGAEEIPAAISLDLKNHEHLAVYTRVISLIRRLVRGEEKNEGVFLSLLDLYRLLAEAGNNVDLQVLEALAVFRVLHALGYIKGDVATEPLLAPKEMRIDLVTAAKPHVARLVSAINAGLVESHL